MDQFKPLLGGEPPLARERDPGAVPAAHTELLPQTSGRSVSKPSANAPARRAAGIAAARKNGRPREAPGGPAARGGGAAALPAPGGRSRGRGCSPPTPGRCVLGAIPCHHLVGESGNYSRGHFV